ncbi:hypothetical protein AGDE_05369 [Angomonas deanei]|uniref:Uncharacterized protein n=1 Tax=Angomonas deanei TaxID=59799 RepID=A0A7G2CU60_9TRYP|nr:hypothetical protein AGDE_05369 [Angomonas deanei]CAD2222829.1 hypothetical protein, conserved [Angomonas deanei]|eukprot:EPY38560.1 hypothetical protein AGDE_05369 [Angomonas deanei]
MELIKKGFVHPNASGSNSLKKVLPAVCPDFQYGVFGTDINEEDGDDDSEHDEQKGENAMGVYRLWYHQESGTTLQDLHNTTTGHHQIQQGKDPDSGNASDDCITAEMRERVWSALRIQLLEYCSLDTKALYEIMREIWKEKEAVAGVEPDDKSGWILTKPTPREISF